MEQEGIYVGIDVAKAQVDVAVRPTGQRWVVSFDETGVGELVSQMEDLSPALVLLEASGGLELPLVAALAAAALPVVVVNPRQVRDFARATGTWPRPTLWTRRSWLTSLKRSDLPCALCGTPKPRPSTLWPPAGTR